MGEEVLAVYKNISKAPQIYFDVVVEGVKRDRIRVLPGSKVVLPVSMGRKFRDVLKETADSVA